jgi:reductive dehalogenase
MKGMGMAGVGAAALAGASPVFHDLDEVVASPWGSWKRAWYVKARDIMDPTVEIDWSLIKRIDQQYLYNHERYSNSDHPDAIYTAENAGTITRDYILKYYPDWKYGVIDGRNVGPLRDLALNQASSKGRAPRIRFINEEAVKTPETWGLPKWSATPEENLKLIRSAFRFFGAPQVGCYELDANTRKLIFAIGDDGKTYEFEDVDQAYETATSRVIPNKCKYMIVWSEVQASEITLREPSALGKSGTNQSYSRMPLICFQIDAFLRGLGYQALSGYSGYMAPSNPSGVLSGHGEHARMGVIVISPEYGSMIRGQNRVLTDMPILPTPPIDAGIHKFCRTCKICAEHCPFGALPMGDASYEHLPWQQSGFKGWQFDVHKCPF